MEAAHRAATLDQRHDGPLRRNGVIGAVVAPPAHVGFVCLDNHPSTAEWRIEHAGIFVHGLTDAMPEKPRGLHAAPEHPLNLAGADALLAGAEQVNNLKPQVQW